MKQCADCGSHNIVSICSVNDCDGVVLARSLCSMHYSRKYRNSEKFCKIQGCLITNQDGPMRRGMCEKHYHRWWRTGRPHVDGRTNPKRELVDVLEEQMRADIRMMLQREI